MLLTRSGSTAGASARARYRRLRAEHRQERALARLVLAGLTGCMAAGLFGWRAGPPVAVAVVLGHAVYLRVRPDAVTHWRQGARAERRTGQFLAHLDPAAYHVMHDRALPDSPRTNLDHLVIGQTGVHAVASRRWPVTGARPTQRLLASARHAARAVADLLADELDHEIEVSAIVAVHGARPPRAGIVVDGVALVRAGRLTRLIGRQPEVFSSAQVATIAAAAERVLPPMLRT